VLADRFEQWREEACCTPSTKPTPARTSSRRCAPRARSTGRWGKRRDHSDAGPHRRVPGRPPPRHPDLRRARAPHPRRQRRLVAAVTIIRNAITRSDAIVKIPSNDPLTAIAIARTLADVAPNHPLTRHLAVAYWTGGDREVEARLYRPEHVEKIVAWGGLASVSTRPATSSPGSRWSRSIRSGARR
jgi:hypothetical protein